MKFPIYISKAQRFNLPGNWRDHDSVGNIRKAISRKTIEAVIQINEDGTWQYLDVEKIKNKEILDA